MTRPDQVQAFKAELIQLAEEGITLPGELLDRIRAHHGALLAETPDERLSLGMRLASFVGAVALSSAVFAWGLVGIALGLTYELRLPHLAGLISLGMWLSALPGTLQGEGVEKALSRAEA